MRRCTVIPIRAISNMISGVDGREWKPFFVYGMLGLVTTVGLMVLGGCQSIPARDVTLYPSKYQDIDQTCEALKTAIEAQGLQCSAIRNLNQSMATNHTHINRQIRVVEFFKADYAHDMLNDNPEVCSLMPCAFGVFEGDDHKIYISSSNQRFMGGMSGRTLSQVMKNLVARDQQEILETVAFSMPAPKHNSSDSAFEGDLGYEMYIGN
jgi:uncharacterized protein (DUF302 family)